MEVFKIDFKRRAVKSAVRQKATPKIAIGETLKYGAELATAISSLAEHGGLICGIGLCDEKKNFSLEKGVKFLVVAVVFFLGIGVVKQWWDEKNS